jgi:hypothetical protein
MLVKTLTKHRLIDEYLLVINPILLGAGHRLFDEPSGNVKLNLVETRPFSSGNVLLRYRLAHHSVNTESPVRNPFPIPAAYSGVIKTYDKGDFQS